MVLRSQDAWRRHPVFKYSPNQMVPGLRNAVVIFGVYLAGEFVYTRLTKPKSTFDPEALKWSKEVGMKPQLEE